MMYNYSKKPTGTWIIAALICAAAGAGILFISMAQGVGVGGDATIYITCARNGGKRGESSVWHRDGKGKLAYKSYQLSDPNARVQKVGFGDLNGDGDYDFVSGTWTLKYNASLSKALMKNDSILAVYKKFPSNVEYAVAEKIAEYSN